jgi:hypothetical protein
MKLESPLVVGWDNDGKAYMKIDTLEGTMTASEGDWIIKGVKGEFYPCKPDIFERTYALGGAGKVSDGFHTFEELYTHRHTLFMALMSWMPELSWLSRKHSDDSELEGWFIAGIKLPTGDVSYHLPECLWDLAVKTGAAVLETGMCWDGHTSADVIDRLQTLVEIPLLPTSHEGRVILEKQELDAKLEKLTDFIENNPIFTTIGYDDRDRLKAQARAMAGYSEVLRERIAAFVPAPEEESQAESLSA